MNKKQCDYLYAFVTLQWAEKQCPYVLTKFNNMWETWQICEIPLLCYLNKEGSLQGLSQVIVAAEQSELLGRTQLSSEHMSFLQLLQLLPESTEWKRQLTLSHTLSEHEWSCFVITLNYVFGGSIWRCSFPVEPELTGSISNSCHFFFCKYCVRWVTNIPPNNVTYIFPTVFYTFHRDRTLD